MLSRSLLVAFCFGGLAGGQQVFVKADAQLGNGILRPYESSCFLLAPLHVVQVVSDDGSMGWADSIVITDRVGREANAIPFQKQQSDLAILKVKKSDLAICSQLEWEGAADVGSILSVSSRGMLVGMGETGSRVQFEVSINNQDENYISVTPSSPKRTFTKGLSGSLISVQGEKVAMVVSVDTKHNEATALRLDSIELMTAKIFIPTKGCQQSCHFSTSGQEPIAEPFEGACPNVSLVLADSCLWREVVFSLPSGWPTYKYLHMLTMSFDGQKRTILGANLSDSKKKNAASLGLSMPVMSGVTKVKNVSCIIKVEGNDADEDDYTVQLRNCHYP